MDELEARVECVGATSGAAGPAVCFERCNRSGALPGGFAAGLMMELGGGETDRRMAEILDEILAEIPADMVARERQPATAASRKPCWAQSCVLGKPAACGDSCGVTTKINFLIAGDGVVELAPDHQRLLKIGYGFGTLIALAVARTGMIQHGADILGVGSPSTSKLLLVGRPSKSVQQRRS